MYILRAQDSTVTQEYGIQCRRLYPWKDVVQPPFGSLLGVVEPGETSSPHNHHEGETFFIVRGSGLMKVDDETAEVSAGDLIYMPAFTKHSLKNTSATEQLVFLTVWWEDMKLVAEALQHEELKQANRPTSVLVTATPPTPNGDLHLGHLSGPYVGADMYKRYLIMRGVKAFYLSGADDHQSYVPLKASQTGRTARETVDLFAGRIENTYRNADIDMDLFVRPDRSKFHIERVSAFFRSLYEAGHLIEKEVPSLYCESCDTHLSEAHVRGLCPHCNSASDGNACEQCCRPNDCVDLVDPVCKGCGGTPTERPLKRLYFPLKTQEANLRRWYETASMGEHLRSVCLNMLADGLPDIAVSHVSDWGIPVPVEGFEDQRIYVWFEMAPGYLSATEELMDRLGLSEDWKTFWSEGSSEIVQFFGIDNGYYHAVLFPALWMAFDASIRLPQTFVTNEFYRLDELKFSTSRNHAVWGDQLLAEYSTDAVRFFLAYSRPETEQTNFTRQAFTSTVQAELVELWNGWLQSVGEKVRQEFGGIAPDAGAWSAAHKDFFLRLKKLAGEASEAFEAPTFSPQRASRVLCELVRAAISFGQAQNCLAGIQAAYDERRTGIALELTAVKVLAQIAAPIMPQFAAHLREQLGETEAPRWEDTPNLVPGGRRIGAFAPYFEPVVSPTKQEETVGA
ncbi:class I tRNA ligase family protein [Tumebacillus flagellatus]|uniref:methionine--tRNA ligase n=1 Tax=Tumebacillus flagellatus TaxID=1157490 RepID=A0A074LQ32_9BACL|nr:class I tRNA ligase family protein [Tumebacillus flagellatus]KEO82585.1 hypothetical protein EL26_14460 [Tumebacillus flagellatus]